MVILWLFSDALKAKPPGVSTCLVVFGFEQRPDRRVVVCCLWHRYVPNAQVVSIQAIRDDDWEVVVRHYLVIDREFKT